LQNLGAAKHGAVKKRRRKLKEVEGSWRKLKEVEGSWRKLKLRSFHVMFIDIRANRFYSSSLGFATRESKSQKLEATPDTLDIPLKLPLRCHTDSGSFHSWVDDSWC
jgi:hypothetical protein